MAPAPPTGRRPSPAACRSLWKPRRSGSRWRWRTAARRPSPSPPPCIPTCGWTTSQMPRSKACRAATTRTARPAAPCAARTMRRSDSTARSTASTATWSRRCNWSRGRAACRSRRTASPIPWSGIPARGWPRASRILPGRIPAVRLRGGRPGAAGGGTRARRVLARRPAPGLKRGQRGSMVNAPKATPRSQPSPVPASASDTSPLVITCALLDFTAPAWASAVT